MLRMVLLDLVQGTKIDFFGRTFASNLKANRSKLLAYQNERLARLMRHAYRNVPYYWKVMRERNISPEQIKSAADLPRLPVLERETLRREGGNLRATNVPANRVRSDLTSGTTGTPVAFTYDVSGYSAGIAADDVLRSLSGWKPGRRHLLIGGDPSARGRWDRRNSQAEHFLMRQVPLPAPSPEDSGKIAELVERLVALDPLSIEGAPGVIHALARRVQSRGLILKSLFRVFTTGEILGAREKQDIEIALAPVADLYGCAEVFGIASRPVHDDHYYVCDPHVIVETEDSKIPGMKDLLVTNLDNRGLPLIRYRVGDLIDGLHPPEKDARFPFTTFRRVMGRNSEIINLPNGLSLHPLQAFGGTLFRQYPAITRHRVVWNGKSLTFVFEETGLLPHAELERQLAEWVKSYNVPYVVEYMAKMEPFAGGKQGCFEIVNRGSRG
ncbi:MAG: phenylacetate--CoA ligase family protein [Candidatus Aminicenantales bacterium]